MGYENPLLKLAAMKTLLAAPADQRELFEALMRDLRAEADTLAEQCWRRRKGPMAAYWRAVSTYARHVAHALRRGDDLLGFAPQDAARQPPLALSEFSPDQPRCVISVVAGEQLPFVLDS